MKKNNLIILIIFLFNAAVFGQQYKPFPTENANWNIYLVDGCALPLPDTLLRRYTLHGDTTINEVAYNKLYMGCCDTLNNDDQFVGGLRESGKKIYYLGKDFLGVSTNTEILLYDFTKKIGDTIIHNSSDGYYSEVLDIDSVLIDGVYRKRYQVNNHGFYHNIDYIIEGIGSVKNGLFGHITRHIPECGEHYWEHICFIENEEVKYLNPSFDKCFPPELLTGVSQLKETPDFDIYPNPAGNRIRVINNSKMKDVLITLIDIHGRTVLKEKIQNELYIIELPNKTGIYNALVTDKDGKILMVKKIIKE